MRRTAILFFFSVTLYVVSPISGEERHDDFVLVTIPKCGTHLLAKAMNQLVKKTTIRPHFNFDPNKLPPLIQLAKEEKGFIRLHIPPRKSLVQAIRDTGAKVIFLYRDPRDQVVSLLFALLKGQGSFPKLTMRNPEFRDLSFEDKLMELITGERFGTSAIGDLYMKRIPWIKQDPGFVCSVCFENLVGGEGGGSRKQQLRELKKIAKHIHLSISPKELDSRSQGLFGKPGDSKFRNGQIGDWKIYFKESHKNAFKKRFGKLLVELGYEKDNNW